MKKNVIAIVLVFQLTATALAQQSAPQQPVPPTAKQEARQETEEFIPPGEQQTPALNYLQQRDVLDAMIEGALATIMAANKLLQTDGWKPVIEKGRIKFVRRKPAPSAAPKPEEPPSQPTSKP